MANPDFRRDSKGIEEILKSDAVADLIREKANATRVAAESIVPAVNGKVVVDDYVTDRAASSVTIRDRDALGWQATTGVLTKAASAAGLEVRAKP